MQTYTGSYLPPFCIIYKKEYPEIPVALPSSIENIIYRLSVIYYYSNKWNLYLNTCKIKINSTDFRTNDKKNITFATNCLKSKQEWRKNYTLVTYVQILD